MAAALAAASGAAAAAVALIVRVRISLPRSVLRTIVDPARNSVDGLRRGVATLPVSSCTAGERCRCDLIIQVGINFD